MQHISPALSHFYERPLKTQHYQNCIFTSFKTSLSKLCLLKGHFLFRLFLLTFFFTSHFWRFGKSWANTRNIFFSEYLFQQLHEFMKYSECFGWLLFASIHAPSFMNTCSQVIFKLTSIKMHWGFFFLQCDFKKLWPHWLSPLAI